MTKLLAANGANGAKGIDAPHVSSTLWIASDSLLFCLQAFPGSEVGGILQSPAGQPLGSKMSRAKPVRQSNVFQTSRNTSSFTEITEITNMIRSYLLNFSSV